MNFIKRIINKIKSEPVCIYLISYSLLLLFLSIFRDAKADETYYLKETALIAELFKEGIWLGDYGVGLHGFLFKIPIAIVFIIFDKSSVFVATSYTISIAVLSLFLFYKIFRDFFSKDKYALLATILLSVVLYFINTSLTFNRDIPALFAVLLFLYLFFKKSNFWLIGLSLLLILDAKEHVFFTVAPLYGFYLLLDLIIKTREKWEFRNVQDFLHKAFSGYIFSFVWIILMFTTSIIPVNMFAASILGLTETGTEWNRTQFSTQNASQNLMDNGGVEIVKISNIEGYKNICSTDSISISKVRDFLCKIGNIMDIIFGYIGKILYPRTFSFISIPKIIVLPAIVQAISIFFLWFRQKDRKMILPLILIFNILIVILRASHGRYLLAVAPMFVIFFILFIRDGLKKPIWFKNTLIASTIFVILGLFFESSFLGLKIVLEVTLLILLWSIWLFRREKPSFLKLIKLLFLTYLSLGMLLTALTYTLKIGQVSNYLKYGYNRETREILKNFDEDEKIWINDYGSGELINLYRGNLDIEAEWYWQLSDWVPKKTLLKPYEENNTFTSEILGTDLFKKKIRENNIERIALVISTIEGESFESQIKLEKLESLDWLAIKDKIELKNKILYIFDVTN